MNKDAQKIASTETALHFSNQDFADWGLADVAYIKPLKIEGRTFYGVFAANGQQLGLMEDQGAAFTALFENDLEPVALH